MTSLRWVGLVGLGILMQAHVQSASAQPAQSAPPIAVDLPAQSLEDALDAFALRTGISLSLPVEGLGSVRSRPLHGVFTVEEGLQRLLGTTGFRFEKTGPSIYRVIAPSRSTPPNDFRDVVIVSAKAPATAGDVPRDIIRIDGEDLAERGLVDDRNVSAGVSGLAWTNLGMGRDKIVLRGLSDGALVGRAQSLAGIYLDDTRITYGAPDPDLRVIDVKAIEVLKGPQGALYGAGSLGGIFRIETNPPELDAPGAWLQASLAATQGGSLSRGVDAMMNLPVIEDRLGLRAIAYDEDVGGWLDNSGTGVRDANRSRRSGGRLAVLGQLDEDWSVTLTLAQQEISTRDSQYLTTLSGRPERLSAVPEPHDNDFSSAALSVHGEWAWASLTSTTSLIRHQLGSRFEATGAFPDLPAGAAVQAFDDEQTLSMLLNETRLSSAPDASMPWLLGVFYADGDNQHRSTLSDLPGSGAPATRYQEARADQIDELAVFGEATLPLTRELSLSAGLRMFRTSLETHSRVVDDASPSGRVVGDRLADAGVAPDIRLRYRLSREVMFYASAAEGYRASGINTGGSSGVAFNAALQPFRRYGGDELWTYELGVRGDFLDNALKLDAVAFASDWRNVQSDMLSSRGFSFSGNAGNARVNGAELDLSYEPLTDLNLNLHLLLNEPELSSPRSSFPSAEQGGLPGSSTYTAATGVRYDWQWPILAQDADLFAEAAFAYVSKAQLGFGGGQAIGDYASIDLRLGVTLERWRVLAFVDNLANSHGSTFAIGSPYRSDVVQVTPQKPRTIGVSIRRTF